jgi:O-antigen/teichoic acid export membrane protein
MRTNYIVTFVAEFLVAASALLVYRLAATSLGVNGFSEYALSRRALSLLQPALILGLGVGLPRYIAYSLRSGNDYSDLYFVSGIWLILSAVSISLVVLNLVSKTASFVLFGSSQYVYLIFPLSIMLVGVSFHILCYTYFQGKLLMIRANLLETLNLAIAPLVTFLVSNNAAKILLVLGGIWCATSTVFFVSIVRQLKVAELTGCHFAFAKELLIYSVQRVPGDFGLAALLSLVAILCAHLAGVKEAGYTAFGVSLVTASGSFFAPIGIVVLPQASQMVSRKEMTSLKHYLKKILIFSLVFSIAGVIFFEIFAEKIIEMYLGRAFLESLPVVRMMALGIVPYAVYVSTRSFIDSCHVKAFNTKNVLLSLLFFIICGGLTFGLARDYKYLIIGFVVALFLLGLLTLIDLRRTFRDDSGESFSPPERLNKRQDA